MYYNMACGMQYDIIVLVNRKNLFAICQTLHRKYYIIQHTKFNLDIICNLIKLYADQY